ncbi:aspartyl-phosphate phosphatase Spo0E family protein [Shouchella clausii]|uniref:aspartyl-phosphate phosphatase Spo0E family protein n=1 Tax=Shouchella clausii TaxID=79880 RepID=UPI0026F453DE|nr:aspartyl-phosphate phosphatase Spo0E family protein [Shouchella clausii]MDO7285920.1 aspartyl-phosphate phosphatase Spo0E family protein [Shouchella clausii]MDO7305823.1 aspartyl-phosphate phosphatase Spo0E family protein [Shouchella clausii]
MNLLKEIEQKRKQMAVVIKRHGLSSDQALKVSQELDILINMSMRKYQQQEKN